MRKWGRVILFTALLNLVFTGQHTFAVEEAGENNVYELDSILVTAPAIIDENEVNQLGSQITHITKEQISDLNAMDLTSALRRVPGVVISRQEPGIRLIGVPRR